MGCCNHVNKIAPSLTTFDGMVTLTHGKFQSIKDMLHVATPLWPSVGVKPNTSKVGDLESSGTLECLELDNKAQNTSH